MGLECSSASRCLRVRVGSWSGEQNWSGNWSKAFSQLCLHVTGRWAGSSPPGPLRPATPERDLSPVRTWRPRQAALKRSRAVEREISIFILVRALIKSPRCTAPRRASARGTGQASARSRQGAITTAIACGDMRVASLRVACSSASTRPSTCRHNAAVKSAPTSMRLGAPLLHVLTRASQ